MSKALESAHIFLEKTYQELGYKEGTLLNAVQFPLSGSPEAGHWLEKGEWLATAKKANIQKIFFVNNDPVLVFSGFEQPPTEDEIDDYFRRVWCMARPQRFFMALPGELRVYDLNQTPQESTTEQQTLRYRHVERVADILEELQAYRRECIESGDLPDIDFFGKPDERADRRLVEDLQAVRRQLINASPTLEPEYAHALIGRSIFIRYLEDRRILLPRYFEQVAENHGRSDWLDLLSQTPDHTKHGKFIYDEQWDKRRYYCVLEDKEFTYALFDKLAEDFNGDLFPRDDKEKEHVDATHLKLLQGFLLGETDQHQQKFFFWAYDFEIIPIELISNIYEEFYHNKHGDNNGTHYTPGVLVEFVLSQVMQKEQLASHPTILDPACGSGIFLVEAFRRIVRYRMQQKGEPLSAIELREILQNQIRGIEIDAGAIYVTAFSLYLALLHYQEPPDILAQIDVSGAETKPLPNLIYNEKKLHEPNYYHILFNTNTFALMNVEREQLRQEFEAHPRRSRLKKFYDASENLSVEPNSFDVILGNPPWGFVQKKDLTPEIRKAQNQAREWCERFGWSIGDNELSQAFIARTLSLLAPHGNCGFLVSTGIFFKGHSNSQKFRQRWLCESTVKSVVNFAHVRDVFFTNAISPFAFVHYQAGPASYHHSIHYWSAKKTGIIENTRSVLLSLSDIKQVRQENLTDDEQLWKIYWWGGHRDEALIAVLNFENSLKRLAKERAWSAPSRGFQKYRDGAENYQSDWLKNYKVLPTSHFRRYGKIYDYDLTDNVEDMVHRRGNRDVYSGWRLLVIQGLTQAAGMNGRIIARLENKEYCYYSSIYGISLKNTEDWERKILIGILWSSLSRYYFFMTSGSWGTWRHKIYLSELMKLPICFPHDTILRKRIIQIVDRMRNWDFEKYNILSILGQSPQKLPDLEQELDDAIFDLYELSEPERDLVQDLCEVGLEFFYRDSQSNAVQTVEAYPQAAQGTIDDLPKLRRQEHGLEGYLYAFLDMWNDEFAPNGEFRWQIIRPDNNPMLAVIFSTQEKGHSLPEVADSDQEWSDVLRRIDQASQHRSSRRIYIDGLVRLVTDTEIFIIKRNERRLWTRSLAREDAEATLLQAIHLQKSHRNEA